MAQQGLMPQMIAVVTVVVEVVVQVDQ